MINIGVIGLGVIAKYYIAAFPQLRSARLGAVCDLSQEKLQPYLNTGIRAYQDYAELLNDSTIDAVVINLPNDMHFEACQNSLRLGKHVCCEKPLTLELDEARCLQELARQTGKTLFTAFHRRYNQPLIELKSTIGSLDQVAHVDLYYLEKIEEHAGNDTWYLDPKKCGGGCIADNGPNAFDTLSWLLGPLTVTESAVTRNERGIDIEAVINLQNTHGLSARTYLDWSYPHGEDKRVVYTLKNGQRRTGDMLQGSVAFKSSLFHEYERVIDDFVLHISQQRGRGEEGIAATELVRRCYELELQGVANAVV